MDLFSEEKTILQLPDADLIYIPNFLTKKENWLSIFLKVLKTHTEKETNIPVVYLLNGSYPFLPFVGMLIQWNERQQNTSRNDNGGYWKYKF